MGPTRVPSPHFRLHVPSDWRGGTALFSLAICIPSGPKPVGGLCPLFHLEVCGDAFYTLGSVPLGYGAADTSPTLSLASACSLQGS